MHHVFLVPLYKSIGFKAQNPGTTSRTAQLHAISRAKIHHLSFKENSALCRRTTSGQDDFQPNSTA